MKKNAVIFFNLFFIVFFPSLYAQTIQEDEECSKVIDPVLIIRPDNKIMLQWNANNMADSFEVISDTMGKNPSDCAVRYYTQNHEQLFSDLFSKRTYQFLIKSKCGVDFSDWRWFFANYRSSAEVEALPYNQRYLDSLGFVYTLDSNTYAYKYVDIAIDESAVSTYMNFSYKSLSLLDSNDVELFLLNQYSAISLDALPDENYRVGDICLAGDTNRKYVHVELGRDLSGAIHRLLFAWKNTNGNNITPPLLIDSIEIVSRFCAVPDSVLVSELAPNYAQISWRAEYGQENFQLEYKKDTDIDWTIYQNVENNFVIENLIPDTYYNVRVKALCDNEESLYSEALTFLTPIELDTPDNIILDIGNTSIFVTWDEVEYATGYNFSYKKSNEQNWIEILTEQNNIVIDSLLPDTVYNIRIKAFYNDIESLWSEIKTFRTYCLVNVSYPYNVEQEFFVNTSEENNFALPSCWRYDSAVYSPSFDFTLLTAPYLSFDYKSSAFVELQISIDNGENYISISNLYNSENFYSKTVSLIPYLGYEKVLLRFVSSVAMDSSFRIKNFVLQNACPSPTNVEISDVAQTSFLLAWQTTAINTNVSLKNMMGDVIEEFVTQNTSQIFTALQPNTIYKIVLTPICETLPILDSVEIEVQTLAVPYSCSTPENLQGEWVHSDNDEALLLTWESEANIWQVVYKDYYAVKWDTALVTINPIFTLRNLELNHSYTLKVRTVCNVGDTSDFTELIHVYIGVNSLENIEELAKDVIAYPNPTSHKIRITSSKMNITEIAIYNLDGKKVWENSYTDDFIDLKVFGKGIYFAVIRDDEDRIIRKKIIVE